MESNNQVSLFFRDFLCVQVLLIISQLQGEQFVMAKKRRSSRIAEEKKKKKQKMFLLRTQFISVVQGRFFLALIDVWVGEPVYFPLDYPVTTFRMRPGE